MAFARHNIEKHRLIEMVRVNPILWDCRLPHYKRSDKKKAIKWNDLGRVFGVNGERVQRTFTSLREIFRRELNHEKLLGARFKSKWEYYEAMAFLKEVIRERKSRERAKSEGMQMPSCSTGIDEYQYFAPNDPNNPNNQPQQQQQQYLHPQPLLHAPLVLQPAKEQQISPQQEQAIQLQPEVRLNVNATQLQQLQKLSANALQTQMAHQPPAEPNLPCSSFSGSSSPSIYIKDEPDSQDETISMSTTNNEKLSRQAIDVPTKPAATSTALTTVTGATTPSATTTKPINSTINCQQVSTTGTNAHRSGFSNANHNALNSNKHIYSNKMTAKFTDPAQIRGGGSAALTNPGAAAAAAAVECIDDDELDIDADDLDDDADDLDDIMMPATAADGRFSAATTATLRRRRESPREVLYSKFGDFLAARLNTLQDVAANELMNKILMLIAEK